MKTSCEDEERDEELGEAVDEEVGEAVDEAVDEEVTRRWTRQRRTGWNSSTRHPVRSSSRFGSSDSSNNFIGSPLLFFCCESFDLFELTRLVAGSSRDPTRRKPGRQFFLFSPAPLSRSSRFSLPHAAPFAAALSWHRRRHPLPSPSLTTTPPYQRCPLSSPSFIHHPSFSSLALAVAFPLQGHFSLRSLLPRLSSASVVFCHNPLSSRPSVSVLLGHCPLCCCRRRHHCFPSLLPSCGLPQLLLSAVVVIFVAFLCHCPLHHLLLSPPSIISLRRRHPPTSTPFAVSSSVHLIAGPEIAPLTYSVIF